MVEIFLGGTDMDILEVVKQVLKKRYSDRGDHEKKSGDPRDLILENCFSSPRGEITNSYNRLRPSGKDFNFRKWVA